MGKSSLSCLVAITVSFSVFGSYLACSDDVNENLEGNLGRNINLTCNTILRCDSIRWDRPTFSEVLSLPGEPVQVGSSKSYLPISGISFDDDGLYRCYCYASDVGHYICNVHLKTICQATVILKGRRNVYNSGSPYTHFVNVTAGNVITIACSEDASMEISDCAIDFLPASNKSYNVFEVLSEHDSCHIVCLSSRENGRSCSVNFTLNVTVLEKSTQSSTTSTSLSNIPPAPRTVVTLSALPSEKQSTSTIILNDRSISATNHTTMPVVQQTEKDNAGPDKSSSFPVMLLVGISIAIFVGILSIICFFIYFSRSKSSSRPTKTQTQGIESPDTNIPIGPTYATVNKSSPVCSKDDDDSERGIPCTDDAYAEVNSAMKEELSTQQENAAKAETSITKDYYSVVNTSNTTPGPMDHGNESDSALYTEVNKGMKQAGKKVGTFSPESSDCNPNIPDVQSYDVLEQPESSEYDAVGVVSTSPAIYAVVDKERKKE